MMSRDRVLHEGRHNMNIAGAVIFLGMIATIGAALWFFFAKHRSVAVSVIAGAVALWLSWRLAVPGTLGLNQIRWDGPPASECLSS